MAVSLKVLDEVMPNGELTSGVNKTLTIPPERMPPGARYLIGVAAGLTNNGVGISFTVVGLTTGITYYSSGAIGNGGQPFVIPIYPEIDAGFTLNVQPYGSGGGQTPEAFFRVMATDAEQVPTFDKTSKFGTRTLTPPAAVRRARYVYKGSMGTSQGLTPAIAAPGAGARLVIYGFSVGYGPASGDSNMQFGTGSTQGNLWSFYGQFKTERNITFAAGLAIAENTAVNYFGFATAASTDFTIYYDIEDTYGNSI